MQQKPERVEVWGTMVRCCVIDEVRRDRLCKLVQRQRECWSEIERIGRIGGEQRFLGWRSLGKTLPQGAATQTMLAANPLVAGIAGLYWSDCNPVKGSPLLEDAALRERLWTVTEDILTRAQRSRR
jgi:hypothetical protein